MAVDETKRYTNIEKQLEIMSFTHDRVIIVENEGKLQQNIFRFNKIWKYQ